MALITSAATGNFNAGATWTGGVVPGVGDEARASNGHTVTITADVTCDEISNAGTGIFTLNDGVTLTANVTNKSTTTSRNCLQFTAASPAVGYIVGNCTGGSVGTSVAAANTSTGTLNITGNCTGGSSSVAAGAINSSTGTLNVTGNVSAGSGAGPNSSNAVAGMQNSSTGTVNITGSITGGSAAFAIAAQNISTGTMNITGNVTGGSNSTAYGVNLQNPGTINITGIASGGVNAAGVVNSSTGTINLTRAKGNSFGPGNSGAPLAGAVGAANSGLGVIQIEELEFGAYGMSPTSGTGIRLKKVSTNAAVFNYVDAGAAKTLVDATQGQMPAATDVRDGVSYASGALTGSCKVPAAASTAFGVPVDNTTGTAVLTPAAIRSELSVELDRIDAAISSRLAPSGTLATVTTLTNAPTSVTPTDIWTHATRTITGGTVDTLTNSPSVPSAASIAAATRTELAVELARVDASVSSRMAGSESTKLDAVKAKTDALNTERLANVATTAIVGNLIAQANS